MKHHSFRDRFLNRKVIMAAVGTAFIIGAVTGAVLLTASKSPSFCATCHVIEPYYRSWSAGPLLDNKHAQENVTCQECHHNSIPQKVQEGFNFITGNYTLPLEGGPDGGRDFCLECHSEAGKGSSWTEIQATTNFEESNPHDSHNGEQECNECHSMHDPSQVMCSQCHFFGWTNDLDEGSWGTL